MPIRKSSVSLVVLITTAIIFISAAIFSYKKIETLIEYNERIQHAQELKVNFQKLISTVLEAQSGQRGFLLTKDSLFLMNYESADTVISSLEKELNVLIENDTVQQRWMKEIHLQISRRFVIMEYMLRNHEEILKDHEKTLNVMLMGRDVMNNIRNSIVKMEARENELLEIHTIEKNKLTRVTPLSLLVLSCISILILLYSFYVLKRELNQRLRFEKSLEIKIEELKRSNNDLEQFAYVASHDLQEPLRKIRSFGDRLFIKQSPLLTDEGKELIDKMQKSALRMQGLIDDLLSFSRLINVNDKFTRIDLSIIIKEVLTDLEIEIQDKKAKIISGPLPTVKVAPSLIRQLFQNIISNSLKFSKPDSTPIISVAATTVMGKEIPGVTKTRENERFHKIIIQDNGIGFEEKYAEKIFVIFQRLHARSEYAGTGIGLAVSKRIMTIHNGYIFASGKINEGATFCLFFPENV